MKKLKIKVFSVIFSLLTIFTLVIFVGSTFRDYMEEKNNISNVLNRIPRTNENISKKMLPSNFNPDGSVHYEEMQRRIYLDFTIYTVILDEDGEYLTTINNTNDDEFEEEDIKDIATDIISSHVDREYIGNLYTNKYSYTFTPNNNLVIMDNTKVNGTLTKSLITNILLFLLCEVVIFIFTYLITKWITAPVSKSFEKQKTFVADASHELKTPLSVIIASTDAYFNDKNDKWIKNIKNESERMNKLVTDLLDLAKTEQDQDVVLENNDLSNIVESSVLTFESLFYEKKIKLKYDITPDIMMMCNEDLITQLMGILIDNAIKHSSEKGKVFVNLSKNNKQIILEVKNSGDPIKEEDEEKIFERFYKVDSSRNRNSNNYGLGLAIAKNIVEKHKGTIKVHSEDGYTTFKVTWNQK